MFGHDDHNDTNKTMPEVHVNEALLEPENLEPGAAIEDHAAAVEDAPGAVEVTPSDTSSSDTVAPVVITPPAPSASDDTATPSARDDASAAADPSEPLLSIKRDALQALSPLLSHLDQTPEEKFRTTMMLIQATDNKDLLSDAYSAAKDISDEKVRAQALLDVVNEINYFTTQK